ncbi:MAG: hypothetical protein LQ351_003679 [Letrouitia transgressa]|nr:MAG: hypothetical protein LQ351_003679 [Letrouitia transgressa]
MSLKRKRREAEDALDQSQEDFFDSPKTPLKQQRARSTQPKPAPNAKPRTPNSKRKARLTPTKQAHLDDVEHNVRGVRDADRSARRKSARNLVERTIANELSGGEDVEEDPLASEAWAGDVEDGLGAQDGANNHSATKKLLPETPSKTGRKGPRRKRTPTPPQHLPPHERYFADNRGQNKTSNNTFSSLSLLSHEEYHQQIRAYSDPHTSSYAFLRSLHSRSFPQWRFEFSQSFNICLYGYGSKRLLTKAFAQYMCSEKVTSTPPQIVMVNGYIPTLTIRNVLTLLASTVFDCPASSLPKLGAQPQEMLNTILDQLKNAPPAKPLHIIINSLDAGPLRRSPAPSLLAQLAASPHIHLLATCDTPNFPLLWDTGLRDQYNWLFHDTTTFESYAPVEIGDVVADVNELLGRSGRRIQGKEGVGYVLKSLPENARSLYRLLLVEILSGTEGDIEAVDEGVGDGNGDEDEVGFQQSGGGGGQTRSRKNRVGGADGMMKGLVEYRTLYRKVVEEFICSNEMGFRQLLKEFHDHQMVVSKRDVTGTEMLGVPFRREEMEAILEELV